MKTQTVYLGIDVSKRKLHLASTDRFLGEFDNNIAGCTRLLKCIIALKPDGIVLEATGGYERLAFEEIQACALSVTIAQPSSVKYFAKSLKVLAKTDKIDAQVIARFGEATKPMPSPKIPENVRKFRALCDRRTQITEDRVREENRLEGCADSDMRKHIQVNTRHLQAIEDALVEKIARFVNNDADFQRKIKIMTQMKGVGVKTASILLAHFPELGTLTRQQVAALAGVAPYPRESGMWKGKRRIYGGRGAVRKAMYMAARTAARWCPVISEFYNRLKKNGKPFKVNIIACARKMLVHLNTLLKEENMKLSHPNEA